MSLCVCVYTVPLYNDRPFLSTHNTPFTVGFRGTSRIPRRHCWESSTKGAREPKKSTRKWRRLRSRIKNSFRLWDAVGQFTDARNRPHKCGMYIGKLLRSTHVILDDQASKIAV